MAGRSDAPSTSPLSQLGDQKYLTGLRVAWLLLGLLAAPLFGDALHETEANFRTATSICLWALWFVGLVLTLIPHPLTLTGIRLLGVGAVAAAIWAAFHAEIGASLILGVAATSLAAGIAFLPQIAAHFVDGASYGPERRLPLKPPAGVLLGPLQLTTALTIAAAAAGPLLLFAGRWVLGAVLTAVGAVVAGLGFRSLHTLARRWIVFVPAGFVLHDFTALTDPVLFRREDVDVMGPALADSIAHDLTMGSSGLALEARFESPTDIPVRSSGSDADMKRLRSILFAPSQPGEVLTEARKRRINVG